MRIYELRKGKGTTQIEIAAALGVSRQVFANYEKEINYPDPYMLIKIADYFEVSIDYLVGRSDEYDVVKSVPPFIVAIEDELLSLFRKLKTEDKNRVIGYACALTEKR